MLSERLRRRLPWEAQPGALYILVAVYCLQFALYFFVEGARVADEELHTPSVAALLAAGYPFDLARLQYTSFCGGCTAETLLVLPLFATFGPSLALWRLVALAAGGLVLVASYRIVHRVEGPTAALLTGALLVLAPPFYRENGIVAFGSHFEVMGLVILALFPWWGLLRWGRVRDAFLLGLTLGLALWFSYSSAFAVPVLVGSWCIWQGRGLFSRSGVARLAAVLVGFVVGIIPLLWTQAALRAAHILVDEAPLSVYGRSALDLMAGPPSLTEKFQTLVGPSYWASIFHPAIPAESPWPAVLYALAQLALLVVAVRVSWRLFRSAVGERKPEHLLLPVLCACLILYLVLFLLFAPYRGPMPPAWPVPANGLRYLVPTVPLFALCAGPLLSRLYAAGGIRQGLAALLGAVLLTTGFFAALGDFGQTKLSSAPLFQAAVDYETVLGRTQFSFPLPGELELNQVAEGLHEDARDRFARRAWLHALGVLRAADLEADLKGAALDSFLSLLSALEPGDRAVVLEAMVARLDRPLADPPWAAPPKLFAALLTAADGAMKADLWRTRFLTMRDGLWDLHLSLSQGNELPQDYLDPRVSQTRLKGFCWGLGFMSAVANRQAGDAEFELDAALPIARTVPVACQSDFYRGLGRGFGERWGYSQAISLRLRARIEPAQRNAYSQAFLIAAERSFLFPVREL